MLDENLIALRKANHMTQEEVANRLNISRQTLSKWETGESVPDLEKARQLADCFNVTLDDLTEDKSKRDGLMPGPRGKHAFGVVQVGEKGQIVIPAQARKIFNIQPGDRLIVLGDEAQGLALISEKDFMKMVEKIHQEADKFHEYGTGHTESD